MATKADTITTPAESSLELKIGDSITRGELSYVYSTATFPQDHIRSTVSNQPTNQ